MAQKTSPGQGDLFGKQPAPVAGSRQVALTPGDTASRALAPVPPSQGDRGAAAVPVHGEDRYSQIAGPAPPNTITDVNMDRNIWSPFQPVAPFGPPAVAYPRTFDYPVGVNLDFTTGGRLSFFKMLQALSRSWGILRTVLETRKDQLMRIPWDVQLIGKPKEKDHPRLKELRAFLKKPDLQNNFDAWMRMQLEDKFVIDAANYYVWKSRDGKPLAAMHVAGETIKPLVDDAGRRPEFPNPAWQQLIKGLPWVNLDAHEFVYAPQRPTPQEPVYGYSEVQMIYVEILQGIKKMLYKLAYWDEGSIPQLIITVPSGWTPEQLAAFQAHFDVMMAGNIPFKSRVRFMPSDSKPFDLKNANGELLKTDEDEWVTRLVCYCFSVSAQPFIRQMNRATAETAQQEAQEEGLHPLMAWVKDSLIAPLIQDPTVGFGYDDCEFVWLPEPEVDEVKQMQVQTGYVKAGLKTPDEAREVINLPPLPDGAGAEAVVETPAGPVPFKETVEAARQKALNAPQEIANTQEKHDQSIAQTDQGMQHAQQNHVVDLKTKQQQAKKPPPGGPGNSAAKGAEVGDEAGRPFDLTALFDLSKRRATGSTRWRRLEVTTAQRIPARARAAAPAVREALAEAKRRVVAQVRAAARIGKAADLTKGPGRRGPYIEPPDPVDPDSVSEITFDLATLGDLAEADSDFAQALEDAAVDAATAVLGEVGLADDEQLVDLVSQRAVAAARDQAAELVSGIDDTTRDMLRDTIASALEDNVGLDGLIEQLTDSYAFSEDRADLIARTEIRDANEQGVLNGLRGARDAGNNVKKEWLLGPAPCPICQENADEGPIDLDDIFPSGDDAPTAHPWCECAITGVIEEDTGEDTGEEADISGDVVEALARIAKEAATQARDDHGRWTSGGGAGGRVDEAAVHGAMEASFAEAGLKLGAGDVKVWNEDPSDVPFEEYERRRPMGDERFGYEVGVNGFAGDYRATVLPGMAMNLGYITVNKPGEGIARQLIAASISAAESMGLPKLELYASLSSGGYVWAKMGFDTQDTKELASQVRERASRLDPEMRVTVESILKDGGPGMGTRLANLDQAVSADLIKELAGKDQWGSPKYRAGASGRPTLGKAMLLGTDYRMELPKSKFGAVKAWAKSVAKVVMSALPPRTDWTDELILELDRSAPTFAKGVPIPVTWRAGRIAPDLRWFGKFEANQPRDDRGRWTSGDAGARPTLDHLFADNLGIERKDMPQIPQALQGKFIDELRADGIEVSHGIVAANELKATQSNYNPAAVEQVREGWNLGADNPRGDVRMFRTMISNDDRVLDGHHRWAVAAQAGDPLRVLRVDLPMRDLLARARAFNEKYGVEARKFLDPFDLEKYSDEQARDEHGRWTMGSSEHPTGVKMYVSGAENAAHADEVAKIGAVTAQKLGFDPKDITVTDENKTFELNGKSYNYAGSATLETGKITLYTGHLTDATVAQVTAHEVMHQKFQTFVKDYEADYERMKQDPDYSPMSHADFMRADGTLKEPYASKYPVYQAWTKAMMPPVIDGFAKTDGVTGYSRAWWDAWQNQTANTSQAMHETLAEIASLRMQGEKVGHYGHVPIKGVKDIEGKPVTVMMRSRKTIDPIWNALYKAVEHHWRTRVIEKQIIRGREATVAYMTSAMAPAEPADAELIKVMFADGENVWLVPEALHKFDAGQARDDRGRWTSGGSHDPGANPRAPYNRDYSVIKDGNGRTLGDLLKSGAPRDAMEAHPAMTQALKDAAAIRDTQTYPGYGTREFMDNRRFADGSRGYDQMSDKLVAKAESYAGEKGVLNGREAHIILGPPGAGKSSYAEPLARQIGAAIADADDAKAMFKEYGGGIGANAVHEESSILTGAVLKELVGRGANLVLPKVGASSGSIERLTAALKAQGYTVHLSVKDVDEATAYTRMIGRFLHNGRLISGKYLGEVDHNPQKVYRQLAATGNYASTKVV